ncbi:MAG: response regulator [Alphaproteobacteria bacterium]|nr:response regulator [Alphaproteobacteria bacterium]
MKPTIMVLEDDALILGEIREMLALEGYETITSCTTANFWDTTQRHRIDLFLIDLMLPDGNGLRIAKSLRQQSDVGIIILTGKSEEMDRVIGLEVGADDYVTKPYSPRELSARIANVLRRTRHFAHPRRAPGEFDTGGDVVGFSRWKLYTQMRELWTDENEFIHLTTSEYELLLTFLRNPNRVLERDFLLDSIHGREWEGYDRTIDGLVSRLRRKLCLPDNQTPLIKTVRNAGYIFGCNVSFA